MKKNWSGEVTKHSIALDLEEGVFKFSGDVKSVVKLNINMGRLLYDCP